MKKNKYRVKVCFNDLGKLVCCSQMCSQQCLYNNKCKEYEIELKEIDKDEF